MHCDGVGDTFSRKDEVLLHSVLHWYNRDRCRVQTFSDIVNHKNDLSLRIIDWLTTNFSKRFNVAIESDGFHRNLRGDYHKNLAAHNKKNFDPFARRRRMIILLFGRGMEGLYDRPAELLSVVVDEKPVRVPAGKQVCNREAHERMREQSRQRR
ncbi:unnamed protein product, partial [Pylaiella littoralis]